MAATGLMLPEQSWWLIHSRYCITLNTDIFDMGYYLYRKFPWTRGLNRYTVYVLLDCEATSERFCYIPEHQYRKCRDKKIVLTIWKRMLVDAQSYMKQHGQGVGWEIRLVAVWRFGSSMKLHLREGIGHSYKQRTYSTFSSYTLPYLLLLGDGEGRKGRGRLWVCSEYHDVDSL